MNDPQPGSYDPYVSLRRPGEGPADAPSYRVLIHKRQVGAWRHMVENAGVESAQQCWDHMAMATRPGLPALINSTTKMRGKQFAPTPDGFSGVIHYRAGSALRVDFRFHDAYDRGAQGDAHRIVIVIKVYRSSAGT